MQDRCGYRWDQHTVIPPCRAGVAMTEVLQTNAAVNRFTELDKNMSRDGFEMLHKRIRLRDSIFALSPESRDTFEEIMAASLELVPGSHYLALLIGLNDNLKGPLRAAWKQRGWSDDRVESAIACAITSLFRPAPPLMARMQNEMSILNDPKTLSIGIHWRTGALDNSQFPGTPLGMLPSDKARAHALFTGTSKLRDDDSDDLHVLQAVFNALFGCAAAIESRWGGGFDRVVWVIFSDSEFVRTVSVQNVKLAHNGRKVSVTHTG